MNAKQLRSSDTGVDAGQIELHWGVFPCGDVVQEIVDILRPLASEKAQNIEIAVEPGLLVRADRAIRAHAIMNIFDKAIKYSPPFAKAFVKLEEISAETVALSIEDMVPGIPSEMRDKVFERFFRVDYPRARQSGGTGLGLAIAKWAVVANDGSIGLFSTDSSGNRLSFELPLWPVQTYS